MPTAPGRLGRPSALLRARLYAAGLVILLTALGNAAYGFRLDAFLVSLACLPLLGLPVWISSASLILDALLASSTGAVDSPGSDTDTMPPAGRTPGSPTAWDCRTLQLMDWGDVATGSAPEGAPPGAGKATRRLGQCLDASVRSAGRPAPIAL